jgi:hypothetical protein
MQILAIDINGEAVGAIGVFQQNDIHRPMPGWTMGWANHSGDWA